MDQGVSHRSGKEIGVDVARGLLDDPFAEVDEDFSLVGFFGADLVVLRWEELDAFETFY